jgi:hypothetical protein
MQHPLSVSICVAALALMLVPAEAACPTSGPKPVPGTLAASNAGCEPKPPPSAAPRDDARRKDEPGVIRSGNTEIRMRGYLQMDVGTGGGLGTGR